MENPFDLSESKKSGSNLNISMAQWRSMHPFAENLYVSDKYYLGLAQKIVGILVKHEFPEVFSDDYIRYVALSLTAYFEDVVSELGLFRAFVTRYRQTFNNEFPWYKIEEEYLEDEVNLVDVRLVLWLSMYTMSESKIPNPENPGAEEVAREVYALLLDEFENAPVNSSLVRQFYDKKLLEDAGSLKGLLMWMSSSCYLLPIVAGCKERLQKTLDELHDIFEPVKSNPRLAAYLDNSYTAFNQRRGPLALYPKEWYVLFRQAKGITEGNEEILNMETTGVYPFVVMKKNSRTYTLRTCSSREYEVDKKSLSKIENRDLRVGDIIITMLFSYKGLWNVCGFAMTSPIHDLDQALEKLAQMELELKDEYGYELDLTGYVDERILGNTFLGPTFDPQKCDELVRNNEGNRMFYFANISQTDKWVKTHLNPPDETIPKRKEGHKSDPIALYITPDYHLLICEAALMIHDPSNPYYSPKYDMKFLGVITDGDMIADEMVEYMLEHHYLDRLRLNSLNGEESGRKLMQDNIRFFLTLSREHPF